ncbi:MAG: signal peptidase I [Victivallaceae bacterium]|nr:signal peptidase I [Victivallaceae bacterium]
MRFFAQRKRKKLYRELHGLRHSQDDLLSPAEKTHFDGVLRELRDDPDPEHAVQRAENAMRSINLHGNFGWLRNLLDLLLVVGAVAFGLRGLFFQPFRIPTSSMQPTLYGIHYRTNLPRIPAFLKTVLFGARRAEATVKHGGEITAAAYHPGVFDTCSLCIGSDCYDLPGDPAKVGDYADLFPGKIFRAGDKLADGDLVIGDHLFVERFSLYFAPPRRGDVMVFTTDGLVSSDGRPLAETGGAYYIKRVAALPGDTIKLENDHLFVRPKNAGNFVPVEELDPRFEKVYSGKGGYQGHNSDMSGMIRYGKEEYSVPENHYFMLGDNSRFSGDSRFFGSVPRANLVGRAFLVFWPLSRRIGLADHADALDLPTGEPRRATFPVMWEQ